MLCQSRASQRLPAWKRRAQHGMRCSVRESNAMGRESRLNSYLYGSFLKKLKLEEISQSSVCRKKSEKVAAAGPKRKPYLAILTAKERIRKIGHPEECTKKRYISLGMLHSTSQYFKTESNIKQNSGLSVSYDLTHASKVEHKNQS